MTVQVVVGGSLEALLPSLVKELTRNHLDPFDPVEVVVPNHGVRLWLKAQLMRRLGVSGAAASDGVIANLSMPFLGALVGEVVDAGRVGSDPWGIDELTWHLWALLADPSVLGDPEVRGELGPVADALAGTSRLGLARRLADLFDRYGSQRPELIATWAGLLAPGAEGVPEVRPGAAWQPRLWRLLRHRIGVPSPAERLLSITVEGLPDGSRSAPPESGSNPAPQRYLFGISAISPLLARLLPNIGASADVHLFLLTPSVSTTTWIIRGGLGEVPVVGPILRSPRLELRDGLLPSWSRPSVDTAVLLGRVPAQRIEVVDTPAEGDRLLGRVQAAIGAGHTFTGPPSHRPDPCNSLQIHLCHGPTRQVEAARDALLHLLADPATDLQPEQILVVCPDLATYAPLIEAVFPASPPSATALPFRIVHRPGSGERPLVDAVQSLVGAAGGRATASEVRGLLALPAVAARFRLTASELERFGEWISAAGVRWGFDADHLSSFEINGPVFSTWRAALDRLILGAAVPSREGALGLGGVAPIDVTGHDMALVARFEEALAVLQDLLTELAAPAPPKVWADRLQCILERVVLDPDGDDRGARPVVALIDEMRAVSGVVADSDAATISTAEFRRLIADRWHVDRGPTRSVEGRVLVGASPVLRSVPARVVVVLGLDGGLAAGGNSLDDLITTTPCVGDRDARSEVRQTLLDAVLAAREHLIITRNGWDVVSGEATPPSVLTEELLAAVRRLGEPLVVEHARHPYDLAYFNGALPRSFDERLRGAAEVAAAGAAVPVPSVGFGGVRRSVDPLEEVTVQELLGFLRRPARRFFNDAGIARIEAPEQVDEQFPIELGNLERWSLVDGLLGAWSRGVPVADFWRQVRAQGRLPVGSLGVAANAEVEAMVEAMMTAAATAGVDPRAAVEVRPIDLRLPRSGVRITGSVDGVTPPAVLVMSPSANDPMVELGLALRLALLVATEPEVPWVGVGIDKGTFGGSSPTSRVREVPARIHGPEVAIELLEVIVDLAEQARRSPLPLFRRTSAVLPGTGGEAFRPGVMWGAQGAQGTRNAWSRERTESEIGSAWPDATTPFAIPGFLETAEHLWGAVMAFVDLGAGVKADELSVAGLSTEVAI